MWRKCAWMEHIQRHGRNALRQHQGRQIDRRTRCGRRVVLDMRKCVAAS